MAVAAALLVAATHVQAQTQYVQPQAQYLPPQTQYVQPQVQYVPPQTQYPQAPQGTYVPQQAQANPNVNWQNYLPVQTACNSPGCAPSVQYQSAPCDTGAAYPTAGCATYSTAPAYDASLAVPACDVACAPPITTRWIISGGAMFITREPQDSYTFSYDSANEDDQYVDAADADMEFSSGIEAMIGRYDTCTNIGWQLSYWQLFAGDQTTQQLGSDLSPGFLDGIRNYDQLDYTGGGVGDGATAADNVNAAQIHRLTRSWDMYNVEANVFYIMPQSECGRLWHFRSLCGLRYVKFRESLLFESDPSETMIDGDADEYRIDITTDNQLYGFQLGGITERYLGCKWCLQMSAKAGLYNNHQQLSYFEGGSAGAATINNGPNAGQMMRVNASDDDLSFLGEFGIGVTRQLGCSWRLGAEYRMLGVTGLALPTDQIYFDTRGINDVRVIDNDGSLLLHGAIVRLERCF